MISKGSKDINGMEDHDQFLQRIKKTLYYGKIAQTDCLTLPVTEMASELFSQPQRKTSLKYLHPRDAAYISYNACVTPCSFVLAVLYLEQLKNYNPEYLQTIAPRELFLISLLVSSKFLYDNGESNDVVMSEWSETGNMSLKKLLKLEREFLDAINWDLFVTDEKFNKKLDEIELMIALKQGKTRGYFTYTELNNLLNLIETYQLVDILTKFVAILTVGYIAAMLTIVGSITIVSYIPGNCIRPLEQTNSINPTETVQYNTSESEIDISNQTFNALDVLKTGIILASIKSYDFNESENVERVSWDWWSSSTMQWLTKTSKLMETFQENLLLSRFTYNYPDIALKHDKLINLDRNNLQKSAKTRIQDQMEQSWHEEWIDTIETLFVKYKFGQIPYGREIKV